MSYILNEAAKEAAPFFFSPPYPKAIFGLEPAAEGYLLAKLMEESKQMEEANRGGPPSKCRTLIRITPDRESGLRLKQALEFFLGADGFETGETAKKVVWFPPRDAPAGTGIRLSADTAAERMTALNRLLENDFSVLIFPESVLSGLFPPPSVLKKQCRTLTLHDEVRREDLMKWLAAAGFNREVVVESPGDFALRGALIDIFSPQFQDPVRLEFDGDLLTSFRFFDPVTQTSLKLEPPLKSPLREVTLIPAGEDFFDDRESAGVFLHEYFPRDSLLLLPDAKILKCVETESSLKISSFAKIFVNPVFLPRAEPPSVGAPPAVMPQMRFDIQPSSLLSRQWSLDQLKKWRGESRTIRLVCHTPVAAQRLKDLLRDAGIEKVPVEVGNLSQGFCWPAEGLLVLTEEEIFGHKTLRRLRPSAGASPFASFSELAPGDFLVHEEYGVSRYKGLVHLKIHGTVGDFLQMEFLGGDKLYLPVDRLNAVNRYTGSAAAPTLHALGGTRWKKVQQKARREIYKMAQDLLKVHALREVHSGTAFSPPNTLDEEFASHFPFDETPDQSAAIEEVLKDMQTPKPMDRLICGDVGYGKTEVAMRSAFKAVSDGRQAALLVPTTILALQHFETFQERFSKLAVSVEMLSRFRSRAEQKETIAKLAEGKLDIVIGTHRLLGKDVRFKNLGLLILDEEHRFGVRHKERIKKLRPTVDVLTLSATPIPRTLHMSLIGLKDLSLIQTPPVDRLAVRTFVAEWDEEIVRAAVAQELGRGGQVFFVHPRVAAIESAAAKISKMFPEATLAVAHGQMKEEELEKVMIRFLHKKTDILVTTTIIESGIDVPNANTILINRADTFGLAQLYQLRGRVGRSDRQAFCYLLVHDEETLTAEARQRLEALTRYTELGAGFQIASHDLELRGAGNLLGSSQSGFVEEIGYEMYTDLLARSIRELKGEKVEEKCDPEIQLKVEAFIPEKYVAESQIRMALYKRMAHFTKEEELAALELELADRFGPPPPQAQNLLKMMEIKIIAARLKIRAIHFDGKHLVIRREEGSRVVKMGAFPSPHAFLAGTKKILSEELMACRQLCTEIQIK